MIVFWPLGCLFTCNGYSTNFKNKHVRPKRRPRSLNSLASVTCCNIYVGHFCRSTITSVSRFTRRAHFTAAAVSHNYLPSSYQGPQVSYRLGMNSSLKSIRAVRIEGVPHPIEPWGTSPRLETTGFQNYNNTTSIHHHSKFVKKSKNSWGRLTPRHSEVGLVHLKLSVSRSYTYVPRVGMPYSYATQLPQIGTEQDWNYDSSEVHQRAVAQQQKNHEISGLAWNR